MMVSFRTLTLLLSVAGCTVAQGTPKDAATQKVAEDTCKNVGVGYVPYYGADGMPAGCKTPTKPMCFFGAYKDPKTGADGCCGKGNGTFVVDPNNPSEGACCTAPANTYSFDSKSNTGSCCMPGLHWSYDTNLKVGRCCNKGEEYGCSCAKVPDPPIPKTCPEAQGWTFTEAGVDYEIFCENGWSEALPPGTWTKATDLWDCLNKCGQAGASCQGVNFWGDNGDCGFASSWEFPPTGQTGPTLMTAIPKQRKP